MNSAALALRLARLTPIYLNPAEENVVPDAVVANDTSADLGAFSLSGEVEQPALQRAVGLAEDLQGGDDSKILTP